jgi:hypothetical protein
MSRWSTASRSLVPPAENELRHDPLLTRSLDHDQEVLHTAE